MRIYTLIIFLTILPFCSLFAQNSVVITGRVLDSIDKNPMEAVSVYNMDAETGTYTDKSGVFELAYKRAGPLTLRFTYVGYETKVIQIKEEEKPDGLKVMLSPTPEKLSEIVVQANSLREKFNSTNTSMESIEAREVQVLPALFGEVDIIKALQLKPGVASGSEGSSSLFVRGGSGDQNLVLFDGVNIYNPSHLFGFFSTFNNDALSSVEMFKGGFPAQYGGRLSSVIDVKTKNPGKEKLSGSGGLGLISSRLTLDGPLFSDKVSFLVSGRRTYVDIFTEAVNKIKKDDPDFSPIPRYRFYDLNGKLTARITSKDNLTFSGYVGADIFGFSNEIFKLDFDWGNQAGSLQWNHAFNEKTYFNTAFFLTDYEYNIKNSAGEFNFNLGSRIKDSGMSWNIYHESPGGHFVQGGLQWMHHKFNVGRFKAGSETDNIEFSAGTTPEGDEFSAFISDQFTPWERIKVNLGMRYSGFTGGKDFYHNLEPRFALNTSLGSRLNLKSSYARMNQYIHLISNNGLALPTDIWYPTTDRVKPQKSDQFVIGLNYLFGQSLLLTNEYYYKSFSNQIELKDHAQIFANEDLESEFTFGNGYAYGTEIGLEKKSGNWTGWVGYTLAWVQRGNFNDIEGGAWFSPKFDRRHDLSIVSSYKFNEKWTVSTTFVFGSGDKAWLPAGRFYLQDFDQAGSFPVVPIYGKRNTITIPPYHRMDLSIVRSFKAKWGSHNLNLSFYNLYDRRNPYFLYLDSELEDLIDGPDELEVPVKVSAKQVSLFPILPSISWNFNF